MWSSRIGVDGDHEFAAAAFLHLWQQNAELAVLEPRPRLARIDGGVHPYGTREAPEVALDKVKAGRASRGFRSLFLARDDHHPSFDHDANALSGHAGDIEDDFNAVLGLENVEKRKALARDHVPPVRTPPGEVVEKPPHLLSEVANVRGDEHSRDRAHNVNTIPRGGTSDAFVPERRCYARPMASLESRAKLIAGDRDSGASELVAQLLPLLADALRAGTGPTRDVVRIVCAGQPDMAPLWNACAAAVADWTMPGRFARVRAEMERAPAALRRAAALAIGDLLQDTPSPRLLTLSYSASVAGALEEVAAGHDLQVVCGEGRPRLEGRRLAARLAAASLEVIITTDAGVTAFLPGATAVVVGADALAEATFLNKVGTYGLVAGAGHAGVPVFVVTSLDKVQAPALAISWTSRSGTPEEIWPDPLPGVQPQNPIFERIPVELVTLFLTDRGPIGPPDLPSVTNRFSAEVSLLLASLA